MSTKSGTKEIVLPPNKSLENYTKSLLSKLEDEKYYKKFHNLEDYMNSFLFGQRAQNIHPNHLLNRIIYSFGNEILGNRILFHSHQYFQANSKIQIKQTNQPLRYFDKTYIFSELNSSKLTKPSRGIIGMKKIDEIESFGEFNYKKKIQSFLYREFENLPGLRGHSLNPELKVILATFDYIYPNVLNSFYETKDEMNERFSGMIFPEQIVLDLPKQTGYFENKNISQTQILIDNPKFEKDKYIVNFASRFMFPNSNLYLRGSVSFQRFYSFYELDENKKEILQFTQCLLNMRYGNYTKNVLEFDEKKLYILPF